MGGGVLIAPDIAGAPRCAGSITLADGNEYAVARAGFGARGLLVQEAVKAVAEATPEARGAAAVQLLHAALGASYSEARIKALVDDGAYLLTHVGDLLDVVLGVDVAKKNASSVTTSTQSSTS